MIGFGRTNEKFRTLKCVKFILSTLVGKGVWRYGKGYQDAVEVKQSSNECLTCSYFYAYFLPLVCAANVTLSKPARRAASSTLITD